MINFLRYSYAAQTNALTFNKPNTRLQENLLIYYGSSIKHKTIISTSFCLPGYQFRTSSSFNIALDIYQFLKVF